MKRRIALLLATAMVLSLAACGKKEQRKETLPAETVPATESQPTEPLIPISYYYGDENAEHLVRAEGEIPELTAQNLIDLLARRNVVPEGIVVWEFYQEDGILSLDLSHEFGDAASQMGSAGEYIIMGSLINTFLDAYEAEGLNLTIEGNPLETGHNIYDFTLKFFE